MLKLQILILLWAGVIAAEEPNWLDLPIEAKDVPAELRERFPLLIKQLGSDEFDARDAASKELRRDIEGYEPLLREQRKQFQADLAAEKQVDLDLRTQVEGLIHEGETNLGLKDLLCFHELVKVADEAEVRAAIRKALDGKPTPQALESIQKRGANAAPLVIEEAGKLPPEARVRARMLLRQLLKVGHSTQLKVIAVMPDLDFAVLPVGIGNGVRVSHLFLFGRGHTCLAVGVAERICPDFCLVRLQGNKKGEVQVGDDVYAVGAAKSEINLGSDEPEEANGWRAVQNGWPEPMPSR